MPNHHAHISFALVTSFFLLYVLGTFIEFNMSALLLSVFFILFCSVFPDVDHKNSRVHKMIKSFIAVLVMVFFAWLNYPNMVLMVVGGLLTGFGVYLLISALKIRHRGGTHTIKASILTGVVSGVLSFIIIGNLIPAIFAFISYVSHIFLDKVSKSGG